MIRFHSIYNHNFTEISATNLIWLPFESILNAYELMVFKFVMNQCGTHSNELKLIFVVVAAAVVHIFGVFSCFLFCLLFYFNGNFAAGFFVLFCLMPLAGGRGFPTDRHRQKCRAALNCQRSELTALTRLITFCAWTFNSSLLIHTLIQAQTEQRNIF